MGNFWEQRGQTPLTLANVLFSDFLRVQLVQKTHQSVTLDRCTRDF